MSPVPSQGTAPDVPSPVTGDAADLGVMVRALGCNWGRRRFSTSNSMHAGEEKSKGDYFFFSSASFSFTFVPTIFPSCSKCQPGQGSVSSSLQQKEVLGSSQLGEVASDAACNHKAENTGPQAALWRPGADVSQGPRAVESKVNISIKAQPGVCPHHLRAPSIIHGGWSHGQ